MKVKKIMDETTNRYEYNRTRKRYLEHREIHCSFCRYHRGDNLDHKVYYGRVYYDDKYKKNNHTRFPNWKLVSKNTKQWMKKPIKISNDERDWGYYIDIVW